jgi:hypothetical protein
LDFRFSRSKIPPELQKPGSKLVEALYVFLVHLEHPFRVEPVGS